MYTQLVDLESSPIKFAEAALLKQAEVNLKKGSMIVFIDALSERKGVFTDLLYNCYQDKVKYIGGGAGSIDFNTFKCIISNDGFSHNSAVFGWTKQLMSIGSAHGWHSISEPLLITKSNKSILREINWKPAFGVYKDIVEKHSNERFSENIFFDIARSYPLGLAKTNGELIVRDPFNQEDEAIHFFDSLYEGEYVKVLHGNVDSLIEGAQDARSMIGTNDDLSNYLFCINCISRSMFLKDSDKNELEVLGNGAPLYGIFSIGEIANSKNPYLEIYNKIVVVGKW